MNLTEAFRLNGSDKFEHGYGPCYDRHIQEARTVLELGVLRGASMRAWQDRWPEAHVMGVDINPGITLTGEAPLEVHIGDAASRATYDHWLPPEVDLIVDDASHDPIERVHTFWVLWPYLTPGRGWYVLEDLDNEDADGSTKRLLRSILYASDVVELHTYGSKIAFVRKIATEDIGKSGYMP